MIRPTSFSVLRRAARGPHFTRFMSSPPSTNASQKSAQDLLGAAQIHAERMFEMAKRNLGPTGERLGNMLGCGYLPLRSSYPITRVLLFSKSLSSAAPLQHGGGTRTRQADIYRREPRTSPLLIHHPGCMPHNLGSCSRPCLCTEFARHR